jgi:hypothetical protein
MRHQPILEQLSAVTRWETLRGSGFELVFIDGRRDGLR